MKLITIAVVLAALPSFALTKDVKKYLQAAATLYENLEYEKALKQIDRARGKANGAEDDTQISLYEGIVLSDMGKEEKALTAFKTGLSLDPEVKLPLEVSPKVEAVFEKARANVKKMLAPQLAREEEERKRKEQEEEKQRLAAAEKARLDEEARAAALKPAPKESTTVTAAPARSGSRGYAWVPAVGGVAFAGVGTVFLLQAKGRYDGLVGGTVAPAQAATSRDEGKSLQTTGLVLTGVGAAALIAAGAMFAMGGGDESSAQLNVSFAPGQAFVGISGPLP
jgi:tetratricopeptide (TPR) repeat protein